jgi:hypothetical protein
MMTVLLTTWYHLESKAVFYDIPEQDVLESNFSQDGNRFPFGNGGL